MIAPNDAPLSPLLIGWALALAWAVFAAMRTRESGLSATLRMMAIVDALMIAGCALAALGL
jgi:hypothetical protein